MLKSLLFSKTSALTLTAVVLTSLMTTPAWSMEEQAEQTSKPTTKRKRSNEDTDPQKKVKIENDGINHFSKCSEPLVGHLLKMPACDLGAQNETLATLAGVCKAWQETVKRESVKKFWHTGRLAGLQKTYEITDSQEKDILNRFYNGKLIYRPNQGSDDGMITLFISGLKNPLKGTFDLSRCGDTGQHLSIATGYRTGRQEKNARKIEIWLSPRFLIARDLQGPASHFAPIMDDWAAKTASVGLFFTWGGWSDLRYCDYLTSQDMDAISSDNLYKKWSSALARFNYPSHGLHPRQKSWTRGLAIWDIGLVKYIMFHLGTKKRLSKRPS